MAIKTFLGGIHPPTFKEFTSTKPIRVADIPKKVFLPLIQHTGAPCRPRVKLGEHVKTGQLIADADAFIASPIHASISGVVKEINKFPHPIVGEWEAITIEGDERDISDESMTPRKDIDSLTPDEMLDIIKRSGIVGLGGAAFPTHVKLMPPREKPIDTVLLNGAECAPYLSCDHRLMLEKPEEIIKGLKIIMKILNANKACIAIEDNKLDAVSVMRAVLNKNARRLPAGRQGTPVRRRLSTLNSPIHEGGTHDAIQIVVLKTKYPQGGEKQLIKTILGKEVPPEKLPLEIGCVVSNVGTAYAIYEAIYKNKPLYERVITVSGSSIGKPQNMLARVGTLVSDLVDMCGGFRNEIEKIIIGGPMTGVVQHTLQVPVIKGTCGIIFLSKKEAKVSAESPCIRCGRCLDVCPVNLIPTKIYQLVKNKRWENLKGFNPVDCVECGACAYDCPSKVPLVQYIRLAKISQKYPVYT